MIIKILYSMKIFFYQYDKQKISKKTKKQNS